MACNYKEEKMKWMWDCPSEEHPRIVLYRNRFSVEAASVLEFDYCADEYASVFLDGQLMENGPERGTHLSWRKNHLSMAVSAGGHELLIRVFYVGRELRPYAMMSLKHGLYVNETGTLLSPNWECRELDCKLGIPQPDWGQAPKVILGPGETTDHSSSRPWHKASYYEDSRHVESRILPPMLHNEVKAFRLEPMNDGKTAVILDRYMCVWVDYVFAGKGRVEWRWHEDERHLGCEEKSWAPGVFWDSIEVDGQDYRWYDLWFRAGKAVEFRFTGTACLKEIHFTQTGYPWNFDLIKELPKDSRMANLINKALWTLQCCTENTYMDCPYYERLQYVADSRVEILTTCAITSDHRLCRNAILQLADAVCPDGAMFCRCPAKDIEPRHVNHPTLKCNPLLPAFSLLFIQELHDFARLREDDQLVRDLLPIVRRILVWTEGFLKHDLLQDLPGWNFLDWLPNWENGVAPGTKDGCGCTVNWIYVRSLKDMADTERVFGTSAFAAADLEKARRTEEAIDHYYYVPERGLYAESPDRQYFSEHAQVWALLAADKKAVLPSLLKGDLDQCGIYFSFYYMVACKLYGKEEAFQKRLEKYLALAETPGLDTLPEEFTAWRSYCHAWSSHSLYFQYAPRMNILDPIV